MWNNDKDLISVVLILFIPDSRAQKEYELWVLITAGPP